MERLGLIAGNGSFPFVVARRAKEKRLDVVVFAIRGEADPSLEKEAAELHWLEFWELERLLDLLKAKGIRKAMMAGQVKKRRVLEERNGFSALKTHLADKVLIQMVIQRLRKIGVELLPSTEFLKDSLAAKKVLSQKNPTEAEWGDIQFGRKVAQSLCAFEIGMTVVVKDGVVVAVESVEGTDQTIQRGGSLAKEGAVVVKMARPRQDMRFDVPVVGPQTCRALKAAHCSVLAVEAGKTLLLNRDETLALVNEYNLCLVGIGRR